MRPRAFERLSAQLNVLEQMNDAQQRGVELERLLAAMFSAEQFIVHRDITSTGGLQVDLVASRGPLTLLTEAKWRTRKAGPSEVNALLDRLEATPNAVAGVLVSMSGFTAPVRDRVRAKAKTPILLLDGHEVRACVRGESLYDLLNAKLDYLTRRQEVLMTSRPGRWDKLTDHMSGSTLMLRLPGQSETRWWESRGGYHDAVFALDLHDIDWGAGEGNPVECDLDFPVRDTGALGQLIVQLEAFDWLSSESSWKFEQAAIAWNGFGTRTLLDALLGYDDRYRGRPMHHTERLIVTDDIREGILTLTADISAHEPRMVTRCQVSLQLRGVPLDTTGIQALAREYEVTNYPVFRPLDRPSITSNSLAPRGIKHARRHRAIGDVVRVQDGVRRGPSEKPGTHTSRSTSGSSDRSSNGGWVVGVLLEDPLARTSATRVEMGLPGERLGAVCAWLRSHHLPEDDNTYSVFRLERARTSEASIFRLMADW